MDSKAAGEEASGLFGRRGETGCPVTG